MFLAPRLAALALVAAVAAAILPAPPFAVLGGGLLVLAALAVRDVLRAPSPHAAVGERRHDPVVSVGASADVSLPVVNPARSPVRMAVRDLAAPSLRPDPALVDARFPPGATTVSYRLRPTRRGSFDLGPITVRAYGPLGLAGRQRTLARPSRLKVYPALEGRRQVEGRLRRDRRMDLGAGAAWIRGGGLEFDSLREYHPDDEFRRINWRATARSPHPVSNVYREDRHQTVLLLLDAGRPMAGTVGPAPRFEHALDAAVAVATASTMIGDRVGAFAFASTVVASAPPRAGRPQIGRIVDAMYDVQPGLSASAYREAIGSVLGRHQRRAFLVLFTDLADEAALDSLVEAIPALARRHLVLVAQVADPEVERLARTLPATAEEAFAKAAAAVTLGRRARGAERLSRAGATVVDRPPGELAPAVVRAYLRAKAMVKL